jgi:hypothetical protein
MYSATPCCVGMGQPGTLTRLHSDKPANAPRYGTGHQDEIFRLDNVLNEVEMEVVVGRRKYVYCLSCPDLI